MNAESNHSKGLTNPDEEAEAFFLRPVKFKSRYVNEFDFEYRNFLATGC